MKKKKKNDNVLAKIENKTQTNKSIHTKHNIQTKDLATIAMCLVTLVFSTFEI